VGKPRHPNPGPEPKPAAVALRAVPEPGPEPKRVVRIDPRDGFPWLGLLAGLVSWVVILAILIAL
jgi:hypothetical protein